VNARVFLVAAEASGDALGADLARELRAQAPQAELMGVGGALMTAEGLPSRADTTGLAVLGFVEGLMAYKRVKQAVAETVAAIVSAKPDCVVLIDSWGFTLRVALGVRAAAPGIKLVKYVGPQVWATRPGRAKTLAAAVDHLICIHEFEVPYYEPFGLSCTVSGHPALGRYRKGDGDAFRARHAIGAQQRILLVLPGSRASEIARVGSVLWRSADELVRSRPDLRLVMVAAESVKASALRQAPASALVVDEHEKEDAFAAAYVALAASGTVTTEVALQGAPLVIGYKLGWITWVIARAFLFRAKFATLMNIAANAEVAPEFLQTRLIAANVAAAAARLLDDEAARQRQISAQNAALDRMGRGGRPAAQIAAEAVLAVISRVS
jgi:lipid-A-disaccharide synthase